jgi:hypothetical protein
MRLVPAERRDEKVPCRHIPINERKETIQSLYVSATAEELEEQLTEWLMNMIQKLELERAGQAGGAEGPPKGIVGRA